MTIDQQPRRGRLRVGAALTTAAAVVGTTLTFGATAALAAPDAIVVNSLGLGGNAVAGVCEATTGAADCTLRGALEIANASVNPEGVEIVFDAALAGTGAIAPTGGTANNMSNDTIADSWGSIGLGARFLVDSEVPVSIDFENVDGIVDQIDSAYAGVYVLSDDVTLSNLEQMRAGEAGIVVKASNTTLSNIKLLDTTSIIQEIGVALLDGTSNTSLDDLVMHSPWSSGIVVDSKATVTNTTITGLESRGVENRGHIEFYADATVDGFVVTDSVFGATDETHSSHALLLNHGLTVNSLAFSDNEVYRGAGAEKNVVYFDGSTGTTLTDTVMDGNLFQGVSINAPLSRIIGDNTATWDGLTYTNNTAEFTRGIRMSGSLTDVVISGNEFTNTREPADAGITLGRALSNVTVSNNLLDTVWAHDAISVEGTSATNVVIEDNDILDFYADVSRSAIGIDVVGDGNIVRHNNLVTDLSRSDLPSNIDNHWAVYVHANAADANASLGWSIVENYIDGFGGKDRSQAPIVHNGIGKLPVTGNTFGTNTRGSFTTDVEHSAYWFFWNVWDSRSNNTVQTFRAEEVAFDGTEATFTAVQPDPELGNNPAVGPVTLHVYWTAADNAEEYLGSIADVSAGDVLTIATAHTDGFIRLQTVDANGFTSQYSSIDPDAPSEVPAAPEVETVTPDSAAGTGTSNAIYTIYDENGDVVDTGDIDGNSDWASNPVLECETQYTVTQTVNGVEGSPKTFTTAACPVDPAAPAAPKVTDVTKSSVKGTGETNATATLRDAKGSVVATTTVVDGKWSFDATKIECGTDYTVSQTRNGLESERVKFTTAACPTATGDLENTGSEGIAGLVVGAVALLVLGGGALLFARRRKTV